MSDLYYISFSDSIKFRGNKISYSESMSDEQINYFLQINDDISENHHMIINSKDSYETVSDIKSILYHIIQLQQGKSLISFEIWYNREDEYPDCPDIYDGWHRIRAYQFMKYDKIPCIIVKNF
jgi:hypothetical protein